MGQVWVFPATYSTGLPIQRLRFRSCRPFQVETAVRGGMPPSESSSCPPMELRGRGSGITRGVQLKVEASILPAGLAPPLPRGLGLGRAVDVEYSAHSESTLSSPRAPEAAGPWSGRGGGGHGVASRAEGGPRAEGG